MSRGNASHPNRSKWLRVAAAVLLGGGGLSGALVWAADAAEKVDIHKNRVYPKWEIHDEKRPRPPVITPPEPSTQEKPGTAPSDAVVLFDGKDLSKWTAGGKDAPWKLQDGAMVADKASKRNFEAAKAVGARCGAFCQDEGLIVRALLHDRIALCPPLVINEAEIGELFDRLERGLNKTLDWAKAEKLL